MNTKMIAGIVAVLVAAVVAYFLFFKGGNDCSESAMTALMPKLQTAMTDAIAADATKAAELQAAGEAMMEKVAAGDISGACDAIYELAGKLGVK